MNKPFALKTFIKDNNLTAKELADKSGYNKNTITNWSKLNDDSKIPQNFILFLLESYPDIDLTKYFPVHAKIIRLAKKRFWERLLM